MQMMHTTKRRLEYGAVLIASTCILYACGPKQTLTDAKIAYLQGDFLRAESIMGKLENPSPDDETELSQKILKERDQALSWLAQASQTQNADAQAGLASHASVAAYYDAALILLPKNDKVGERLKSLKKRTAQRTKQAQEDYAAKVNSYQNLVGPCSTENITEYLEPIRAAAVSGGLYSDLRKFYTWLADACLQSEQDRTARQLYATISEALAGELDAGASLLAQQSVAVARQPAQDSVPVVSDVAASFSEESEVAVAKSKKRARRRARRRNTAETPAPSNKPTVPVDKNDNFVFDINGSKDERHKEVEGLFNAGSKYQALLRLDELIEKQDSEKLSQLKRKWTRTRKDLIGSYLRKGESALRKERPDDAYQWYERIKNLDPAHRVATDRLRKLEALRALKQGNL